MGTRQNRLGGSNEYPQAMLVYTPVNPFYYIKVGFKGVKIIQVCYRDGHLHAKTWSRAYLDSKNPAYVSFPTIYVQSLHYLFFQIVIINRKGFP